MIRSHVPCPLDDGRLVPAQGADRLSRQASNLQSSG
jgi:hypothetical protein